jgi:BirA family biotin operon repressor/biotin-[acetyl-CoA-carboxylase] ligase
MGRAWEARPGDALLMSVVLRPALPAERLHLLTVAVALAARHACASLTGCTPELKWPNDLLVDGRKLAGILAEVGVGGAVVVGLGLNLDWSAPPPGLEQTATCLRDATGVAVARDDVLDAVLRALAARYAGLASDAGGALLDEYRRACATVGRAVRVELPGAATVEGVAVGVSADGHLEVESGGERRTFAAGDVVHLR